MRKSMCYSKKDVTRILFLYDLFNLKHSVFLWSLTHSPDNDLFLPSLFPHAFYASVKKGWFTRLETGKYSAICSIEMIEAVGEQFLGEYFNIIFERLTPGGRAAIQVRG